jgi:hypothetical protein
MWHKEIIPPMMELYRIVHDNVDALNSASTQLKTLSVRKKRKLHTPA